MTRWRRPRLFDRLLCGACAVVLTGCGTIHSAPMWFARIAGMDEVNPQLYVEPEMSAVQREELQHEELQRQIELGRAAVVAFHGDTVTTPCFVACLTTRCDERFGSYGQRAAAYGDLAIRLSAKGLSAPLIAHEWAHAALYRRCGGGWSARRIARWFDEGVAVVIADEPRHSENNGRDIQSRGLPTPPLGELVTFSDWGNAVRAYGETGGDGPGHRHVVYTAAGHEVRTFAACAGPAGGANVLGAVGTGSTFGDAYAAERAKCVR